MARRTARVRVVVENQDGRLRPGMFAKGTVMASTESRAEQAPLVIPVTAPLMTGRRAIVYVETRQGADFEYEARVVRRHTTSPDAKKSLRGTQFRRGQLLCLRC